MNSVTLFRVAIQPIVTILLTLLVSGCASQSEVDTLRKQIESMKSERDQHQQSLSKAVEDVQEALDRCKIRSASDFDTAWEARSAR